MGKEFKKGGDKSIKRIKVKNTGIEGKKTPYIRQSGSGTHFFTVYQFLLSVSLHQCFTLIFYSSTTDTR
jgi:hypothetical protein